MSLKKVSMILFVLGALISLFSSTFPVVSGMENIVTIILVILGVLIGLLNISDDEHFNFLIASTAFLISSGILLNLSPGLPHDGIFLMLHNFMVFIAPATMVIGMRFVFEYASETKKEVLIPLSSEKKARHESMWDILVFVAVAFVLVSLILESFFDLTPYPDIALIILIIDYVVLGIFVVDLFVIYNKQRNLKTFFTRNWMDLIAVIPFGTVFRLTKLVRLVRMVKVFARAQRVSRINRVSKFFSDESGFNKLLDQDDSQSDKVVKKSNKSSKKASKVSKVKKSSKKSKK